MTQNCSMRETNDERKKSLISCLKFAAEAHENQKRKDSEKTPYINHPIGVAYILSYEGKITNLDLLRGCLLHDTVEDTSVTIDDIRVKFGDYIGNLVQEVTDDKSLPKQKRKDLQMAAFGEDEMEQQLVDAADEAEERQSVDKAYLRGRLHIVAAAFDNMEDIIRERWSAQPRCPDEWALMEVDEARSRFLATRMATIQQRITMLEGLRRLEEAEGMEAEDEDPWFRIDDVWSLAPVDSGYESNGESFEHLKMTTKHGSWNITNTSFQHFTSGKGCCVKFAVSDQWDIAGMKYGFV